MLKAQHRAGGVGRRPPKGAVRWPLAGAACVSAPLVLALIIPAVLLVSFLRGRALEEGEGRGSLFLEGPPCPGVSLCPASPANPREPVEVGAGVWTRSVTQPVLHPKGWKCRGLDSGPFWAFSAEQVFPDHRDSSARDSVMPRPLRAGGGQKVQHREVGDRSSVSRSRPRATRGRGTTLTSPHQASSLFRSVR